MGQVYIKDAWLPSQNDRVTGGGKHGLFMDIAALIISKPAYLLVLEKRRNPSLSRADRSVTLQPDFVAELLAGAHQRGINTAVETACNVPWAFVEKVMPHVDIVLHDHKLTDPLRHKKSTGADNRRILETTRRRTKPTPTRSLSLALWRVRPSAVALSVYPSLEFLLRFDLRL